MSLQAEVSFPIIQATFGASFSKWIEEPGSVDLLQLQGISAANVRQASFIGAPNLPIIGTEGNDVLRGAADADVFVFAPGDGAAGDQIIDFEVGVDPIDLSATGLAFGDLSIVDVGANVLVTYGMNTLTVFNTTAAELDSNQFEF